MGKFNKVTRTGVTSPIKSVANPNRVTGNGAKAFARDEKSELFLLAVSNFVGQDTFYEDAKSRDNRFANLSQTVAIADSRWFTQFVGWLRNEAFMRSASIVAAVEGAKALYDNFGPSASSEPRHIVAASMARADEPGEVLAYYQSNYGKNFPAFLKKGVADGARKLYNEYSLLKYDTESKGYRFADVIQLSHAKADDDRQNNLFQYALNRRYGNEEISAGLHTIRARQELMSTPVSERRAVLTAAGNQELFRTAGMTWEALSGWLQGPMDAKAWEAVIPSMGYMALLRNLRNFLQAGVSAKVLKDVLNKLSDPEQVAKSKQFPFRFLSAYQANKGNLKVSSALEEALEHSLANVPSLKGRTLILVDRSDSMTWSHDRNTDLTFADQAAIFGSALALRAEDATLVQFGSTAEKVSFRKSDSVLPMLDKYRDLGGTNTAAAVSRFFDGHDRVIIVTDEQYSYADPASVVPKNVPLYTWNLNGYANGGQSGNAKRHTFGGLTDKAFVQVPMIEAGQNAQWPWEAK